MNYLNNDELERYWFKYKSEEEPTCSSGIDEKVHQLPDGAEARGRPRETSHEIRF